MQLEDAARVAMRLALEPLEVVAVLDQQVGERGIRGTRRLVCRELVGLALLLHQGGTTAFRSRVVVLQRMDLRAADRRRDREACIRRFQLLDRRGRVVDADHHALAQGADAVAPEEENAPVPLAPGLQ